jgi:hypothetical protein
MKHNYQIGQEYSAINSLGVIVYGKFKVISVANLICVVQGSINAYDIDMTTNKFIGMDFYIHNLISKPNTITNSNGAMFELVVDASLPIGINEKLAAMTCDCGGLKTYGTMYACHHSTWCKGYKA